MKLVNLNSVCKILNGYAFKSEEYQRSGAPLIRISNFNDGLVEFDENSIYVDSKFLDSKSEFIVRKGDILIALSGATTGKYGLYLHDFPSLLNQRIGLLKSTQSSQLESKYFYYYLNILKNEILNKAGGAAQPNISTKAIGELQIPLPPLEQQKKIAAILDAADEYRQKTKSLIAKYDELTQSLFLDMFGDPVKNEKGWEVKTIEQIVKDSKSSIKRGPFGGALKKEIFVEDGYLVYEQFHALNNDFSMARYFIDERKFIELKGFEVKPKDIIISCSGVYLGKLAIVPDNARKGIINQALLKITLNEEKMKNNFFVFLFSHKNFREKYFDANRGAGIPNFPPMSEFKKFPFISPPINIQNQFAERVQAIEEQKAQAQASLEKAEDLFNSLLQRAFKGELV
jgi:type I restriction enzyme, S subunit